MLKIFANHNSNVLNYHNFIINKKMNSRIWRNW